jgi:hypothetical protein
MLVILSVAKNLIRFTCRAYKILRYTQNDKKREEVMLNSFRHPQDR